MPIREYRCPDGHTTDELIRSSDPIPSTLSCACGLDAHRVVSAFARTPSRFGDSTSYFDRGLGCQVDNHSHRQRVMKERNLMEVSDLPSGTTDQYIHTRSTTPTVQPATPSIERGRKLIEAVRKTL